MKVLRKITTTVSAMVLLALLIIMPVSYHLSVWNDGGKPVNHFAVTIYFNIRFFDGGWFSRYPLPYSGSMRGETPFDSKYRLRFAGLLLPAFPKY